MLFALAGCDGRSRGNEPQAGEAAGGAPTAPCRVERTPPTAPGGYYVDKSTICTQAGEAHVFRGLARPSLEWSPTGEHLSARDFKLMASWGANVVRLPLNQAFWLEDSPQFAPGYADLVDEVVEWAKAAGMDVILDLHWSEAGKAGGCDPSPTCQQQMADERSITFWSELAGRYRGDGRVLFELYNEPHDVTWEVWKSGGETSGGFRAAGMQQLYDAVRAAGADNLVIIGGLDWAFDLSGVPAHRIDGYNIVYATHPYNTPHRQPASWDESWGFLTATDAVMVTEFGNLDDPSCSTDFTEAVIAYADAHGASWAAWAWFPGGCTFPGLIEDWRGTPSAVGSLVRAALLAHSGPRPEVEPEQQLPLAFSFDEGTEGWLLNNYQDPDFTNLGAPQVVGAPPAQLSFSASHGDPSPGSLELRATITAPQQYVIANTVVLRDLTGVTLRARVRLESGTLNGARVSLHACALGFVCKEGPSVDPASLMSGDWVPLTWDLGSVDDDQAFDLTQIISVGVQLDSTRLEGSEPAETDPPALNDSEALLRIDELTSEPTSDAP
jgi:endoglucanase